MFSLGGVEPRPYGTPLFYCVRINHRFIVQKYKIFADRNVYDN
ncbi:hypothetical protein PRABACTJOHN_01237 [Parabacteroides johnsonii DSM 18315]|uniref:Uncharacterized protein n=1 Tax=Parabacteroides johnsonii DSM 18315 TaxID=537006 RepID=B7B887_9BACT|nr:hypothetical protein PRABACTJOHN_01237 [Parabacteroides johnsonii DSM 18315]